MTAANHFYTVFCILSANVVAMIGNQRVYHLQHTCGSVTVSTTPLERRQNEALYNLKAIRKLACGSRNNSQKLRLEPSKLVLPMLPLPRPGAPCLLAVTRGTSPFRDIATASVVDPHALCLPSIVLWIGQEAVRLL